MVDAIVSFAVQRLGDFLIQEAAILSGVKKEVAWLQKELRLMRSFLKDAEQKQDSDERIQAWVSSIQDIAYDTEDVIETFIFTVKGPIRTSKKGMLSNSVMNCFGISTKVGLYGIGKEIKDIRSRVLDVTRQRESYGINNIGGGEQEGTSTGASILRDLRLTTSYADEEHVVGFDDDAQFLGEKLFQRDSRVLSILGMGGLGKTTLARKLYNHNNTKFNLHAWVCVSQEWKTRDLLERLIKSFKRLTNEELERLERMKDYDMELYLRELLERRRYLVVIDDVWQKEAWESLKRALPDQKNGSKIIITTRKEAVVDLSDHRTYVHNLRYLRPDESWQLFCMKAFPENNGVCPLFMEKLGKEMMAKCGGLPLAIIVLGGLLSRKQFHEWHVVKERIWCELKKDSNYISSLLALSYKDLPHKLKSCFLYLGLFPEDFVIDVEKLIQLWVAEEFVTQEEEGLDLEELAENYLKELIGRSLILVVQRNWRTISTCQVHDLLRDLAVNKAKELNFLHISDETLNSAPSTVVSSCRRIAFRSGLDSCMSLDHSHQQVRTLFSFTKEVLNYGELKSAGAKILMQLLYTRFRLLRVLDLEGVSVTGEVKLIFDETVGKLIHLRYLGLNHTGINELPESLGNLQALRTLNVDHFYMLATNICKLKQLRHLKGSLFTGKGRHLATPLLFEELENLQCLMKVDINGLLKQKDGDMFVNESALNAFAKLRNLKFLSLEFSTRYKLSIQPLLNCRHLIELKIDGGIGNLPIEMQTFLPNLKFLSLRCYKFEQDPIPALEMLPNLLVLELVYVQLKIMTYTATGFPHLEVLTLSSPRGVTKVQVEEGAMPRLRALTMDDESLKRTLPQRLRSLPNRELLNWDW